MRDQKHEEMRVAVSIAYLADVADNYAISLILKATSTGLLTEGL